MPTAPRNTLTTVDPRAAGWDGPVTANFQKLEQALDRQPTQHKRAWRDSGSNSGAAGEQLNLVDFDPTQYEGHWVHLMDPEVGEAAHVYSDGTAWKYVLTDNALTGIV